jgi:CIC family chloride channel protein
VLRTARRKIIRTLGTASVAVVAAMVARECEVAAQWVVRWPTNSDRWWSIVVVAGAVLSMVVVRVARTTGQTTSAFTFALAEPPADLRPVPARLVATSSGVGLGTPLGLDGPALHLGGALGARVARLVRRDGYERAWTIAAGVAALSMAIEAPVAAAFYVVEIGDRRRPRGRDLMPLTVGAAAAWAVRRLTGDWGGIVGRALDLSTRSVALAALVVGAVCGVLGGRLADLLRRAGALRWSFRTRLTLVFVVLALAVPIGWAATDRAIFVGSRDGMLQWAASAKALPLAAAMAAFALVVVALVAAELVGGVLLPLFTLGSLVGLVLARTWLPATPTAFVVVAGGCAMVAAVQAAPMTAVALGFAALGWSASGWCTAAAVLVAVAAAGRRPGPHVRS